MKEGTGNTPRVTIDTNLVISGLISPYGNPAQLLTAFAHGTFHLVLTDEIFAEIQDVLGRNRIKNTYHIAESEAKAFLDNLAAGAEFVKPVSTDLLPVHSRDEKDDILLACAFSGRCDYLVTGDEDLLILNSRPELGSLHIIKAAEFLRRR